MLHPVVSVAVAQHGCRRPCRDWLWPSAPPAWWWAVPRECAIRIAVVYWHVAVAHLRCERTTTPAHKAVPAKVGHLERRHLPRDLEIL